MSYLERINKNLNARRITATTQKTANGVLIEKYYVVKTKDEEATLMIREYVEDTLPSQEVWKCLDCDEIDKYLPGL